MLSAVVSKTDIICNGSANGTITISSPAGGFGTYQYSINGGTTWSGSGNFTNLIPGAYNVMIRDGAVPTCALTLAPALTITEPPALSAAVASTNVTCFGSTDGTITVSGPAGGSGTFEYSINGGGSWQASGNFVNLAPGTYNVQIRDAVNTTCYKVIDPMRLIIQPAVLKATVASAMISCHGANDGTINITAPSGGSGTYQYTINGGTSWGASGSFAGLAPGSYDIRIRDAANTACEIILNPGLSITEPDALSGMVMKTDITCNAAADGKITITNPLGGYGTYEFSINGGGAWQISNSFTGLSAGTYNVIMRDRVKTSCTLILNPALVITEPSALSSVLTSTDITCFNANDGTITISLAAGGYGTYQYSINGGATWVGSGNFTNLAPGTYNVQMRDAGSPTCVLILNPTLVITQPFALSATVSKTNITCFGAADGTITVSGAAGGYGTYEYTIDGGATWQASNVFTGLTGGFYNVKLRDALKTTCVFTVNASLNIIEPSVLNAGVTKTNITCNGGNNGTITISSPTGGYGTYEYTINGGTTWQASGSFTGLVPGTYNVKIRDASKTGCIITLNAALVITEPAALAATLNSTNITCFGANNGSISITGAAGGYGTYEYTIDGGATWSVSNVFNGLAPATYNVRMRDAVNTSCILILNGALPITQPPVLDAAYTKTDVSCFGTADGIINITGATGGYGTYQYSVNGGGSWQPTGNFTGLVPGTYNVQIRDAAQPSCALTLAPALSITQPAVLNATVAATMITCNGTNDGTINITVPSGGYGTYEYSINGGTSWSGTTLYTNLAPGNYDVRIRDAAHSGCSVILRGALSITEPAALTGSVSSTNVTCNGASDGTITITGVSGGYGTYEYTINGAAGWQAASSFTALGPGSYDVRVRDKAHPSCEKTLNASLVMTQPNALTATVTKTNISCFGANDGSIVITGAAGGYGTYDYSIDGGLTWQSSGTFMGLIPNTYNVMLRDAAHIACAVTLPPVLVITQPAVLSGTVASTNVTCNGAGDGTITVSAPLGGYGTYEYSINGGAAWQASGSFSALAPGFYNVQIRDAAHTGCVKTLNGSLQVSEPSVLAAGITKTNVTCNGSTDGTITIIGASGGYGTYEFSVGGAWQASGSFTGLPPATYTVSIRDAAHTGCVRVLDPALVITQPAILSATVNPTMITCNGANDGIINITGAAGGYGLYQYTINGGTSWQGSGTFMNLAPANYDVRIRDAMNPACVIVLNGSLPVTEPGVLNATLARTNVTCFGGSDGTITISAPTGGYGTYEYSVNGGGSWQASGNFSSLSPGNYTVLIRDAAHTMCMKLLDGAYAITQPAMLTATVNKTDITCNGANNGSISITAAAGGSGTYEYSINGGTSWQASGNYINLLPGNYDVRIRDAAATGCTTILYPNLVISEPLVLNMTSTGNIILDCFDDKDAMGTFFGSGGTLPYTFAVTTNTTGATIPASGFNSQSFFNGGSGTISVTVTDSKGCTASATITVTQPALLTPGTVSADQVICSGQNPALINETVPATGGPGAYTYQWQYSAMAAGPFITIAGATSATYTPPAGATATLYYRRMVSSGICSPVYSNVIEIKVNPLPLGTLAGGEIICPGQTSKLNVNIPVGTGPFDVDIENYPGVTVAGYASGADINVSPAVTTTYKLLRIRDANGCTVTSPSFNLMGTATVTVRTLPAIVTSPAARTVCEYAMTSFSVSATGSDLTYQWYVNEGSGFTALTDSGPYIGSNTSTLSIFGTTRLMNGYVYHVVVSGCSTTLTSADAVLTVNQLPEIQIQPKDTTACLGAGAQFSVTATGAAISYTWQVSSGAGFVNVVDDATISGSATNTITIVNAPASYNNKIFRVKLTGACGAPLYSNFAILKINLSPTVSINPVNKAICDGGGPIVFSASGSGQIDSLRWQVFSGGTWKDVHDDAVYSGSSSQQLTLMTIPLTFNGNLYRMAIKAKCITVYTNTALLTVNSNPVVNFAGVDPVKACGGVPVTLHGNPTGGSGTYTQHLWTGDVGPLSNYYIEGPVFKTLMASSYMLNYRVKDSNGCYGSDDLTVTVDSPSADFIKSIPSGCTPLDVTFTKDMTGLVKFWWDFGDGTPIDSVNANPAHTFVNTNPSSLEYFDVKLRVRSAGGCEDTYTSQVISYPRTNAAFTLSNDTVCSGGSITFTSAPGANKYFWDYGDGSTGYSLNEVSPHTFINITAAPVTRTVTLTTTSFYGCTDTKTSTVVVMPKPLPQFSAAPVTQIYNAAGNPVTFTNETNAGTWNYNWKFGDGSTSVTRDPAHTYSSIGTFTVRLTVSNQACTDSIKHNVSVTPIPPVADFAPLASGCAPLAITLNNTSLNTDTPGTTFYWSFGDGSVSTARNPTYTYFDAGAYRIELTVTGPGGVSTFSRVIEAYPSPLANLRVAPTYVFVNDEPVRFFNLSQGGDTYIWDFGDGDTSRMKEPMHKYMEEGVYDITLWAYSNNGCVDQYILSPGVTVEPAGDIRFGTVFRPNMTGPIELDHAPEGPDVDMFFYPPIKEKVNEYKLQIFNRWGVLIFESHDINKPWNGYYKGELCQQGVYVWYVEGKYLNGSLFRKAGDITLLH
ncbi:MAG TPA: PKD domain-containing protein [Bacteroidales bacterium]|nr:PKD domain-containing protein [Bacteroidales bacterium]